MPDTLAESKPSGTLTSVIIASGEREAKLPVRQIPEPSFCEPCICCEPPTSVMDDNIGLEDESASVVIVGGGPHALAALAALEGLGLQQSDGQQKIGTGTLACHQRE